MNRSQKPALSEPRTPERFLDSSDSLGMTVRCRESNGSEIRMQNAEVRALGILKSEFCLLNSDFGRVGICR